MAAQRELLRQIGNTPLIELTGFDIGCCQLFVKLENHNPSGSIKDRIALTMIEAAEREGKISPGGTVIEATAGNTGLGLACIGVLKGYQTLLVIPDKMSREKVSHLRALGAKVVLTRSDVGKGHPEYYQDLAESIARETPNSLFVNQFCNPANPLAHETSTAPEIWSQMGHDVDAIVCGVGSGGTLTGLSRFFARVQPDLEMVLADPEGSILAHYVHTGEVRTDAGSWLVEGIGEDFIPEIADLSRVKKAYSISDRESLSIARDLLRLEGIFGGSSAGTLVAAALRYCREQTEPKRVVTFICDSGNKYLSKMFSDLWMVDHGLLETEHFQDLRDLISHKYRDGRVITVSPDDTLLTAYNRMRTNDVSQLPVLRGTTIVGMIDESDILLAVRDQEARFKSCRVSDVMSDRLVTLSPRDSIDSLYAMLEHGLVAIVMDGSQFLGLVTKMDLLNYLRRRTS